MYNLYQCPPIPRCGSSSGEKKKGFHQQDYPAKRRRNGNENPKCSKLPIHPTVIES